MTGPICNEHYQRGVRIHCGILNRLMQQRTDGVDDLRITVLILPADDVRFADLAALEYREKGACVVVHEQPIADVVPLADPFAGEGVHGHDGITFSGNGYGP